MICHTIKNLKVLIENILFYIQIPFNYFVI
jgi:hypothetical protein